MLQALSLVAQLVVLARLRVDPGDLVETEAQQVGFLIAGAGVAAPVLQIIGDRSPLSVVLAELHQHLLVIGPGEPVQRGALLARAQQPELIRLPMHSHHLLTQLGQHRHRHRATTDVGPRSALDGDRAGQQQAAITVHLGAGISDPLVHLRGLLGGQPQPALDHRPAWLGAHPRGIGPAAEQQAQAGHHHRLSGAGLARDDIHPPGQRQRRVLDDAEPGDAQLL